VGVAPADGNSFDELFFRAEGRAGSAPMTAGCR
jgi:hypothetical protein